MKRIFCGCLIALALLLRLLLPRGGRLCAAVIAGTADEQVDQAVACFSRTLVDEGSVRRAVEEYFDAMEAFTLR